MLEFRVTVGRLRADHPDWVWTSKRVGMSWIYEGRRGDRVVTVKSCAVLCGPSDDDFATRWMIAETGESYASWSLRHSNLETT